MKIGIFYQILESALTNGEIQSFESGMEQLKKLGVSFVTMNTDLLRSAKEEKDFQSRTLSEGVSVQNCYYIENVSCLDSASMAKLLENAKAKAEQAARLNSKQLMPIVSYTNKSEPCSFDELNWLIEYLERLSEIAGSFDLEAAVENNARPSLLLRSASEVDYLLSHSKNIGFILDTGNFWFTDDENTSKIFINSDSDRIAGVHLKDVRPGDNAKYLINKKRADLPAIGSGVIPILEIIDLLKVHGCDRAITVELDGHRNGFEKICRSLFYLQKNSKGMQ